MKKWLAGALALLALILTMTPGVWADQAIAHDSASDLFAYMRYEKNYPVTLEGKTITLDGDVALDDGYALVFRAARDDIGLILDLNGHTLSGDTAYPLVKAEKGTLTVTDSAAAGGGAVVNRETGYNGIAAGVSGSGQLHINAGTFRSVHGVLQESGVLSVSGGVISGEVYGVYSCGGSAIIRGGAITGGCYGVYAQDADLTLQSAGSYTIEGGLAAAMMAAKQSGRTIQLACNARVFEGRLTNATLSGWSYPYRASLSTDGVLPLASWTWGDSAKVSVPSGLTKVTVLPKNAPAYIDGFTDGSFKPEALIERAQAAAMFTRAADQANMASATNIFKDVVPAAWYARYVGVMIDEKIIDGYPDGTFRPSNNITRAEYAAMVCRFMGLTARTSGASFTDVKGHWAEGLVHTAASEGWLANFTGTAFVPNQPITRGEAVQMLNLALGRGKMGFEEKSEGFSDVSETHSLYDDIMRAASVMR